MPNNVGDILNAFEDALQFWTINLSANDLSSVPPATVADPLKELVKIAKLIKAHTTKVGIIFEPSHLKTQSDAAYNTTSELSKSFVLFMSALAALSPEKVSNLFYKEVNSVSSDLVANATQFAKELKLLKAEVDDGEDSKSEGTNGVDPRLVSVGKVWTSCDVVVKLIENGNVKFLEQNTKSHLALIDDGLEEFAEWAENPGDMDDDPFGLDEFSDEEEEILVPDEEGSDSEEETSKDKQELIAYCKQWLQKFKLIKLLFLSINKSLPSITKGSDIDLIYANITKVSREIDQLIVELMMNQVLDEQVDEHAIAIDKSCQGIINILRTANKKSESKVKWCGSWESKYKELLEKIYS